jgi:hypothetical protein
MVSVAAFLDGRSQSADDANLDTGFTDRVWRLLDRIDCRPADSGDELAPIFVCVAKPVCARGRLPPIPPKAFPTRTLALENQCTNH